MRLGLLKWPRRLRLPSLKQGWRGKIKTDLKTGAKYVAMGAILSAGAKGVSHLVNMNKVPEMGNGSEYMTLEDFSLALLRVDTVEASTDAKRRFPASFVTWIVISYLVNLVICIPVICVMSALTHHCSLGKLFK